MLLKIRIGISLTTLLLGLTSLQVLSQETWSLEQCINYALENNIQIKQQNLNVQVGENQLLRSKMSAYPNLNASASHNYYFGRAIDNDNSISNDLASSSFSINSSFVVFNGFQISNSRKQENINLQALISDVEELKNNVALNIASAYLQILYTEELVETTKTQVKLSQLQSERTTVLVKAGSIPEGNLLEIEAQLASDELQMINAQNQFDMAYLLLAQLLDIKTNEKFRILKPNIQGFEGSVPVELTANLFEQSLTFLPQIKSADLRVSSAEKGLEIAKGGLYPRLTLGVSYSSGSRWYLKETPPLLTNDPFMEQLKNNASTTIGANLSIPIFNGFQVKTSISNATINLENSRLNLENEKNILFKDIQQAHADAIAALKKYKATEKSLSSLEEAFRYSEQKFNVGLVNSFDYTTSKTRLAKAQADLIQAKYEFIFKSKILDFYRGVPLKL